MAVDHVGVIESEGARVLAAYRSNPDGRVPWSDRWTVRSVARHVAGSHHAVALILAERPRADFEQAAAIPRIETNDPAFPEWFTANTERLLTQCRTVPPAAVCWAPHPLLAGTAAYWTRRIAYDTLVHRWDAEAGAGIAGAAMEPEIAADAVDEMLDVGLRVTRAVAHAPAGPAIRLACADALHVWDLDLSEVGRLTIPAEPIDVTVTLRGTAEALLLWLWRRIEIEGAAIEVDGDRSVLARWTELLPTSLSTGGPNDLRIGLDGVQTIQRASHPREKWRSRQQRDAALTPLRIRRYWRGQELAQGGIWDGVGRSDTGGRATLRRVWLEVPVVKIAVLVLSAVALVWFGFTIGQLADGVNDIPRHWWSSASAAAALGLLFATGITLAKARSTTSDRGDV